MSSQLYNIHPPFMHQHQSIHHIHQCSSIFNPNFHVIRARVLGIKMPTRSCCPSETEAQIGVGHLLEGVSLGVRDVRSAALATQSRWRSNLWYFNSDKESLGEIRSQRSPMVSSFRDGRQRERSDNNTSAERVSCCGDAEHKTSTTS